MKTKLMEYFAMASRVKKMAPALLLFALCGCGTGYNYSPYVGLQQPWATQSASYIRVVDRATFYPPGQLPDRPYAVLGNVTADNDAALAKAVHEQHADAALIYADHTYRTGTVAVASPGVVWAVPLTHTVIHARLIKFI